MEWREELERYRAQAVVEVQHVQTEPPAGLQVQEQPQQGNGVGTATDGHHHHVAHTQLDVLLEGDVDGVEQRLHGRQGCWHARAQPMAVREQARRPQVGQQRA